MFSRENIIIVVPILLFAVTVHEFSHAWVADKMGDSTAKRAGRMTLNPIVHLDLVGTLVMVFTGLIGWAKPVPVNPFNFRDWRKGTFLVSAAGPASNLLIAAGAAIVLKVVSFLGLDQSTLSVVANFLYMMIFLNCVLAFFNLIPLPPLDGSKIMFSLLPPRYENHIASMEQYGPMILIGVIVAGLFLGKSIIWMLIGPFVDLSVSIFTGI